MQKSRTSNVAPKDTNPWLPIKQLRQEIRGWMLDGNMRHFSPATMRNRGVVTARLLAFLEDGEHPCCGPTEIRLFLAHLSGYESGSGESLHLKASTVRWYFNVLQGLFAFLVESGTCDTSPMSRMKPPLARPDQVQPFTRQEMAVLLEAAKAGRNPRRDPALIYFLLDTGLRASEVCAVTVGDIDFANLRCTVCGKGSKTRSVYFGNRTGRALWTLAEEEPDDAPLFQVSRGQNQGGRMTRLTVLHVMHALGRRAKVADVHPHRFRHTFAVNFLNNGGNIYSLQALMGHATLQMVQKYLAFSQADLKEQHRQASPTDQMFGTRTPRR